MSPRSLPLGFTPPCLPTKAPSPPSGDAWLHEIKHDGFRIIARKDWRRHDYGHARSRIQTKFTARQQRTTLTEASPPASDGTL